MKHITREFYRANFSGTVRFAVVWVICAAALFFTGCFNRESTQIPAIIVTGFLGILTAWTAIDFLIAPNVFKQRLEKLPEDDREEILSGFSTVPSIGKRWFYERFMLFFTKRRIELINYDELESADMKRNKLYLRLSGGETLPLPFSAAENPAVLVAALRSRNGKLKASIDGRPVNFDKGDKSAGKKTKK